MENKLNVREYA